MLMTCLFQKRMTRLALLTGVSLLAGSALHLVPPVAAPAEAAPAAQNASGALEPVQTLYAALNKAQTSGSTAAQRNALIGPAVDQVFDLETILRRSVGMRYASLAADERTRLFSAFRRFTITRYASTFKPGTNVVFDVSPQMRPAPGGGVIVSSTLKGRSGENATPINYVMTQRADGWRITDILLNGHISQVAAQHADFSDSFSRKGADGLAALLNHKADLALHD